MPVTSPGAGLSATNPQATPTNAIQLKGVAKTGTISDFAPTYTWAVTSAGTTTTFTATAGHTDTRLRYMKWRVVDENGTEAFGTLNVATPAPVAVTTSGLNPRKKWTIYFDAEVKSGSNYCHVGWQLEFPGGYVLDNPTGSGQAV